MAFSFQTPSCDFLGMDGGVCRGCGIEGHAMGQRAGVLWALPLLPVGVAWAWSFRPAAADLCASRNVGSMARAARSAARPGLGGLSSGNRHARATDVGRLDVRLLVAVAG